MMHFLYFDPGLGAMIIQAVIAAVLGVILFFKGAFYKFKLLLAVLIGAVFFSKKGKDKVKSTLGVGEDSGNELFDDINIEDSDIEKKTNSDD